MQFLCHSETFRARSWLNRGPGQKKCREILQYAGYGFRLWREMVRDLPPNRKGREKVFRFATFFWANSGKVFRIDPLFQPFSGRVFRIDPGVLPPNDFSGVSCGSQWIFLWFLPGVAGSKWPGKPFELLYAPGSTSFDAPTPALCAPGSAGAAPPDRIASFA